MRRCSTFVAIALAMLLSPLAATAQNSGGATEKKLMVAGERAALLNRIAHDLVGWKAKLNALDPGKGNPSYDVGKFIEAEKLVALGAVNSADASISRLRAKWTIYQELGLADSVDVISLFFAQLADAGVFNNESLSATREDAAEMGAVQIMLKNDGMERLRLLEASPCGENIKP